MRKVLLGVVLMAAVSAAPVQADHHTTAAGSTASVAGNELLFGTNTGSVDFNFATGSQVNIGANIGYYRGLTEMLQVGIEGGINLNTGAPMNWNALAMLNMNFGAYADAMFVGAGFGLVEPGVGGTIQTRIKIAVGKRFELMHGLYYRPTLEAKKNLDGTDFTFSANFLALSYMW